jgi:hypothetical protein
MKMKMKCRARKSRLWTINPQAIHKLSGQPKPHISIRLTNGQKTTCSQWVDLFVIYLTMLSIIQTIHSQMMDDSKKLQKMGKKSWPNLRYYPICLKELREAIQTLCLDSQYPSQAMGITAQVNLPSTKIGVNDLSQQQQKRTNLRVR